MRESGIINPFEQFTHVEEYWYPQRFCQSDFPVCANRLALKPQYGMTDPNPLFVVLYPLLPRARNQKMPEVAEVGDVRRMASFKDFLTSEDGITHVDRNVALGIGTSDIDSLHLPLSLSRHTFFSR